MRNPSRIYAALAATTVVAVTVQVTSACTNFIITKGASADGSVMITYSADSHQFMGELYYRPAGRHLPGETLEVYEWDTGKLLGRIAQAPVTYNVVGNMNEHQVAIGETTFGGREELRDPKAIMDYGSLIYIALQRSRTAREAIEVITSLVAEYGYYSSGESMSISDANEAWIFEIIGKGPSEKGAVWVARKVPDGYISGHANHARIQRFPLNDSENTLYATDVISFARKQGYFSGKDEEFSFADAYAPTDFGGLRFCDARVWCMFRRAAPSLNLSIDSVIGQDDTERLPLWIKPDKKLSVRDVMELMRDHYEGTEMDMTTDIGAGPYELPYRWRPMTWKVDGEQYLHERATSTQQTGWSFVSQSRSWLPNAVGGVLWFGLDDTYSTVYMPMYSSITRVPPSMAIGSGSFKQFSWDSAFWVFNFVSNYAYLRYSDMIKDVQTVQRELEGRFLGEQTEVDTAALALQKESPRLTADYLTEYSVRSGEQTVARWRKLGEFLIWKYLDGNVKDELGNITHPGYPESWYRKVAAAAGDRIRVRTLKSEEAAAAAKEAEAKQIAAGIFKLLEARGFALDPAERSKIEQCTDVAKLKDWLVRAATIEKPSELLAGV